MSFQASDWCIKQNPNQNDFTGTIVGVNDPHQNNRAQVRIPFLHSGIPDEKLPWFQNGNIQGNVKGETEIKIPVIGSTVKVAFENDDFYTGTFYDGYKATQDIDTSFMNNQYGQFDGHKDQWGNWWKAYNCNGLMLHTKGISVDAKDTMFRGNLGTTTGVTTVVTLYDGTVLQFKDGILIGATK